MKHKDLFIHWLCSTNKEIFSSHICHWPYYCIWFSGKCEVNILSCTYRYFM